MPFINAWSTADRRVLVSLADPVISVFIRYIQRATDNEAGGLLLGTVHAGNIAVLGATVPTVWDRRLRYLFERLPFGHRALADTRWRSSGGTVRYLGEWHTHPEDYPAPSGLDRREWNKLSRRRADVRPMLAVIVGRKGLYLELVPGHGKGSELQPAV